MDEVKLASFGEPINYSSSQIRLDDQYINQKNISNKQYPTVEEVRCHLKILKAFQLLNDQVVLDHELGEKSWTIFIANASKRFIIFVSSLKESFGNQYCERLDNTERGEGKKYSELRLTC